MTELTVQIALGLFGWVSGFAGAWFAIRGEIRTEMRWLRRDIEEIKRRVERLETRNPKVKS